MISWEKIVPVAGPKGRFVIRLAPEGRESTMTPAAGAPFYFLWEKLRLLVLRYRPWSLSVRQSADDPHGPVLVQESYGSRREALDALERIRRELESVEGGGVVEV